jgi:hypothetical protein
VRIAACGRRWGKTESLAVDIATLAIDEAAAGRDCRQLVVAPTETQARLIGNETLNLLLAAEGEPGWPTGWKLDLRQRPALQVTLYPPGVDVKGFNKGNDKKARGTGPSLSRIIFRTAGRDGRSLRGLWAHRITVDEAGYVPDSVLSEVLLPMLTDVGGDLTLASSPAGRRNVFYRLFARGEASPDLADEHGLTFAAFQCPSTDNPHINSAFLKAMADELGESRFAQEYGAQFVDDYGAVFRADDIDGCIQSDSTLSLDNGNIVSSPRAGHWYAVGVDWGRKLDFTVVCVLDCSAIPARLVGLWRMQGMGWESQAAQVGQIVAAFRPLKVLADGNSIGDPLAERLQKEIRGRIVDDGRQPMVERFIFGSESKTALVDRLTCGLSARTIAYPAHPVLLKELRGFEYGQSSSTGRHRMAAAGAGHDDIVMALALAWWSAPDAVAVAPAARMMVGSQLANPVGRLHPA